MTFGCGLPFGYAVNACVVDHCIHPTNSIDLLGEFVRLCKTAEISNDNTSGLWNQACEGMYAVEVASMQYNFMAFFN